jgi:DNA-binding NtrC family response regulator
MPIFETFLHRFATEYNSPMKKLTEDAQELLAEYNWPGNVRELRNVAEQVVVLLRNDEVTIDDIRPLLRDLDEFNGEAGAASTSLMRVEPDPSGSGQQRSQASQGDGSGIRERELLYRAILEMRMEMSEMKEQIRTLVANIGVVVPRDVVERSDFPGAYDDFVVVRDSNVTDRDPSGGTKPADFAGEVGSRIKDVAYEVDDGPGTRPSPSGEPAHEADAGTNGAAAEPAAEEPEPDEIPTLEEAERELITQALKRFDGNRRKTSRALGISERTLYRKLKDIDEDL